MKLQIKTQLLIHICLCISFSQSHSQAHCRFSQVMQKMYGNVKEHIRELTVSRAPVTCLRLEITILTPRGPQASSCHGYASEPNERIWLTPARERSLGGRTVSTPI